MRYSSISTRQSSFLISRFLSQSSLLPKTVRIWANDKECFEDSYAWAAAVQKVDDNIHWNHCCQERVKEHNVCNPCVCGHVQLQDRPMQAGTKPSLRMKCAQRERSGQAVTVIHKVLDAFSSQMQTAEVARLRQGLALSTTDCSSTSGCGSTQTLGHHCTRTGTQNFLQRHCNVALCTVPQIRHYTTISQGIPPVLLAQTQKCPALQQTILWGTSTKSLTQQYSKDGCREMLQAKRVKVLPLLRGYSSGRDTVEKKLLQLMDMWEVEDAVALLRASVQRGVVPHPNVVLNLQQQLANLGEVECLMELHHFLKVGSLKRESPHCFLFGRNAQFFGSGFLLRLAAGQHVPTVNHSVRMTQHNRSRHPTNPLSTPSYFALVAVSEISPMLCFNLSISSVGLIDNGTLFKVTETLRY